MAGIWYFVSVSTPSASVFSSLSHQPLISTGEDEALYNSIASFTSVSLWASTSLMTIAPRSVSVSSYPGDPPGAALARQPSFRSQSPKPPSGSRIVSEKPSPSVWPYQPSE